ncbi:hypothetical protein PsorP6_010260 [Peronosclerospora sorghi]|uniref:Uncharacterized protein n=1 Tax=Peronosclerospora sorghi TaxID=230839 RepID=A0ACC0VVV4_9STRA|nr:hypothetical protein PsorP6_010260 [Peronosclerospora sorghi]
MKSPQPYTAEQLHMVRKIKTYKSHNEVLGVAQNATENGVMKPYRKLSLKLHPDKNSAPGAEDAFKTVDKAFSILSDPEKRSHYDRYGNDAPILEQQAGRKNDDDITRKRISTRSL